MSRIAALIPVGLFLSIATALGVGLGHNSHDLPSMLVDKAVPVFALPPLVKGVAGLKTADLSNGDVVLLNIFASWCGGCRYEHPMLMRIASDKRIKLVGINWKDEPAKGASWISEYGNPYKLVGDDSSGRTGIDFGVTGVPETFVIDRDGRVRYRHAGPLTPEIWKTDIEPVIAQIEERS
jgi:cytochrome c biogenesis protein CcmG/thiol:disulfide interchange protein DsbE